MMKMKIMYDMNLDQPLVFCFPELLVPESTKFRAAQYPSDYILMPSNREFRLRPTDHSTVLCSLFMLKGNSCMSTKSNCWADWIWFYEVLWIVAPDVDLLEVGSLGEVLLDGCEERSQHKERCERTHEPARFCYLHSCCWSGVFNWSLSQTSSLSHSYASVALWIKPCHLSLAC